MDRSKQHDKPLSTNEVDQLLTAIQDLDNSVAYLRKLLQKSIRAQADDDLSLPIPNKIVH